METKAAVRDSQSHFVRLGGQAAVVRLVDAFYEAMEFRPEAATIRAMHEPDLARTRIVLASYLTEWLGGDKVYSAERGAPMLRRRHHRFAIDTAARDAWMLCMREALNKVCADSALSLELDSSFYKVADFMRNTESS